MPRKYIRKCPDRKTCTREQIEAAKKLLGEGKSKRTAAGIVGIDESTLRKRLKLNCIASSMGRYKPTFTHEQEDEIYNHCKTNDEMFFGLTLTALRKLVYEYAEINNIEHRFDKTTKMAGKDWVYEFLKRRPDLALRQSTPTSIARAIGFNEVQVKRFYSNLKECQDKYEFPPGRIYNMDETGMSTVPKKTPKVISLKGKKNVNKIVSGERGQTITAVCCVSATGNYVPPAFIFPRKRMKGELMDAAPTGSVGMTSDSGFINTDLYLNWLQHFKDYVSPTVENPVLLIIDNHSSHLSLHATLFCRKNGIVVLTLPPHCSHKLQPLDRAFFSPLKGQYTVEADRWMAQHPGRAINQYQVTSIFDKAFKKVANVGNATSAFRVTGIYPFNDGIFTESDFAPASVTDMYSAPTQIADQIPSVTYSSVRQQDTEMHQMLTSTVVNAQTQSSPSPSPEHRHFVTTAEIYTEPTQTISLPNIEPLNSTLLITMQHREGNENMQNSSPSILETDQIESAAVSSSVSLERQDIEMQKIITAVEMNAQTSCSPPPEHINFASISEIQEEPKSPSILHNITLINSNHSVTVQDRQNKEYIQPTQSSLLSPHKDNSDTVKHISLTDLSPLPKAVHIQKRRTNANKSEIVTASPYKNKLEEKQKEKDKKAGNVRKPKLNMTAAKKSKKQTQKKKPKDNAKENKKKSPGTLVSLSHIGKEYFCPLCKEKYQDPPREEWIECNVCRSWWHEDCTNYENGQFTCDYCVED